MNRSGARNINFNPRSGLTLPTMYLHLTSLSAIPVAKTKMSHKAYRGVPWSVGSHLVLVIISNFMIGYINAIVKLPGISRPLTKQRIILRSIHVKEYKEDAAKPSEGSEEG